MSKIYKVLLTIFMVGLVSSGAFAQKGYWAAHSGSTSDMITDKAVSRKSFPKEFKLFDLNTDLLRKELFSITGAQASKHSTIISLPNADGQVEQFEVFEASNFEPALQARFPEIRAFSGRGITDRYATLKLSISPQGIETMVFRTDKANEFSEPYTKDHNVYAVYKSQRNKGELAWTCSTADVHEMNTVGREIPTSNWTESSAGQLKVMRLAQSVTAEYSNYFGATSAAQVGLVLAGINATLTRCNGCYEKDLGVHLNLISNTTDVIYYNASTDPYSAAAAGAAGAWNTELMNTLHNVIGDANFDIGHLFGASGGGGNAGCIGCVCTNVLSTGGSANNSYKGSGFTSPADAIPQGDNFDIDYVVHEVGHQLGANHTFSFSNEGYGVNKEVGSGVTIMGYAGITSYDLAPHSIDIYHEASIAQIQANLATKTCPVTTDITANNATPVVAAVSNYTIPITTPFALTGSATDANASDVLTYCWEQNDNVGSGGTNAGSSASTTKTTGPNWLSWSPTVSPTRLLPKLSSILTGASTTAQVGGDAGMLSEALSSVARILNFRLTVRDNHPYSSTAPIAVGQTAYTDMVVTVSAAVGPFLITSQNSAVSYAAGSSQAVTWSVNGTTGAPTNTSDVKISWSSDGGNTFTTLIASTPNDGTENITIPAGTTTTGRIKVEAIGNIYFDINNANITVTAPSNDFAFGTTTATTVSCPAGTPTVTIPTTVTGTFVTPIVLTATAGVPAGTTVTFAPNPLTPGSSTVATLNNASTLAAGTYTITVTGTAGTTVHTTTITYIITAGAAPVITTQPTNQTVCAPTAATFTVASSTAGVSYQWQSATAAAPTVFSNITGATSASYNTGATSTALNGTVYHVIVYTQCGTVTSSNVTLTVNTAAAITTQPTNQQACTGNTATFTVGATGTGVTYQWQSSATSGGTYSNVSTGTGGTTPTYTTAPLTVTTDRFYRVIVTTTTCAGTVTSNEVTLTTSVTTAINTQPTAQTVCAPTAATFTVAAVGTSLTYQWQVSTAAVPTFTNVSTGTGGTTASYNTGVTDGTMSGNSYRVIVTGTCNAVTSNAVTLTVNTAPAVTTAPAAITVCSGSNATFSVTATGTNLTYQWQSATALAGPYTNVAGATSSSLNLGAVTAAQSGVYYRVVITGTCTPAVTTTGVLLTVNSPVVIGTQPSNASICYTVAGPNNTSFTVAATGTAATYQWQVSTDGTNYTNLTNAAPYSGVTTNTLNITGATLNMTGYKYRVLISGTCTPAGIYSNVVTLTVLNPVVINADPVAVKTCAGATATFTVDASGSALTYQWQVSSDGVTYGNLSNGGIYSGVTTPTLTLTNVTTAYNGFRYRVVVTGTPCGIKTTAAALLTVNDNPSVVLTIASNSSINPSTPSQLYTTVSPVGNYTYQYKRNGVVTSFNTATVPLSVDLYGTYQVTVTNTSTGCSATSNSVTAKDSASGRVFIYPNPNKGMFQVRYYNAGASTTTRTLSVFDSKGAKVYTKAFPTTAIYERMDVNIAEYAAGTYFVEVRGADGKLLATGKVKKD